MPVFLQKRKFSAISAMHFFKLLFRSALFVLAVILFICERLDPDFSLYPQDAKSSIILMIIWVIFAAEMILRLFPSRLESMGCQKQFKRNYRPVPGAAMPERERSRRGVLLSAGSWILLNGFFGALYLCGVIGWEFMLLLSLAYSVCDMICILYFCPFQTWFLKNKCCGSCRIYNWDYAMMFTPLIFVPSWYTWSLLGLGIILLLYWELTYARHTERFYEQSNASLRCANCPEKLCSHKKQLQRFLKTYWAQLREKM